MKFPLSILLILVLNYITPAQELNCRVQIFSQQIQTSNKHIFESMQKDLYEFINNRKWTDHVYSFDERIECSILINLTEQISTDQYKGTLQVQAIRPVYNTNYNSVVLNFKDNEIVFNYVEFQSLDFNENSFTSNLTSLIAYYIYVILGFDYDSFSLMGGTPYFRKPKKLFRMHKMHRKKAGNRSKVKKTDTGW